jgi:hypothetical protein
MTLFVFITPYFKLETGGFPYTYYLLFFIITLVNSILGYVFFVSVGSFQARITDKTVGGTYM